jgi:hypothetical protein
MGKAEEAPPLPGATGRSRPQSVMMPARHVENALQAAATQASILARTLAVSHLPKSISSEIPEAERASEHPVQSVSEHEHDFRQRATSCAGMRLCSGVCEAVFATASDVSLVDLHAVTVLNPISTHAASLAEAFTECSS